MAADVVVADAEADGPSADVGDTSAGGSCATYCALVQKKCFGDNSEYISNEVCLNMCKLMTPGAVGAVSGDTVACRAHYAQETAGDLKQICRQAGPTGGTVCGPSRCDIWCNFAATNCKGVADAPFTDLAGCKKVCDAAVYDPTLRDLDGKGGTLNCLIYQLENTFQTTDGVSTAGHCMHLTTASGPCKAP